MNLDHASNQAGPKEERLARRDWILLPLLSLATILLLLGVVEFFVWQGFSPPHLGPDAHLGWGSCTTFSPHTGVRGVPNTTCWENSYDDRLVEYKFNNCGYRGDTSCGPKQPGVYRIVLIGSSYSLGDMVAWKNTFAAHLLQELTRLTGRKVEIYNEGMIWGAPHSTYLRFDHVLHESPGLILWVLTPWDIQYVTLVAPVSIFDQTNKAQLDQLSPAARLGRVLGAVAHNNVPPAASKIIPNARIVLRHFIYESEGAQQYVQSYLMNGDDQAGYLKADLSPAWQKRLREFAADMETMQQKVHAAGIPMVATLAPDRPLAAMLSMGDPPPGRNPFALDNELRSIVTTDGAVYLDVLPGFRPIPESQRYFFPVDGHPDAQGQAILSRLLAKPLPAAPCLSFALPI